MVRNKKKTRLILPRSFTIPLPPSHDCANNSIRAKRTFRNPVDNQLIMKNIIFTDLTFSLLVCTVFFPTVSLCFFFNLLRLRSGILLDACICLYIVYYRKCIQYIYPYFQFKETWKFGATFVYFYRIANIEDIWEIMFCFWRMFDRMDSSVLYTHNTSTSTSTYMNIEFYMTMVMLMVVMAESNYIA